MILFNHASLGSGWYSAKCGIDETGVLYGKSHLMYEGYK